MAVGILGMDPVSLRRLQYVDSQGLTKTRVKSYAWGLIPSADVRVWDFAWPSWISDGDLDKCEIWSEEIGSTVVIYKSTARSDKGTKFTRD